MWLEGRLETKQGDSIKESYLKSGAGGKVGLAEVNVGKEDLFKTFNNRDFIFTQRWHIMMGYPHSSVPYIVVKIMSALSCNVTSSSGKYSFSPLPFTSVDS